MSLTQWTRVEDAEVLLARGGTGLVLKHSTRCPISAMAHREFECFIEETPEVPAYLVLVVENRELSQALASKLAVPHASPQAILVHEGDVVWHASHGGITRESLAAAWSKTLLAQTANERRVSERGTTQA